MIDDRSIGRWTEQKGKKIPNMLPKETSDILPVLNLND